MNAKLVVSVGLKVLAAVVTGVTVFIGIDRSISAATRKQGTRSQAEPEKERKEDQQPEVPKTNVAVAGLRGIADTCSKLLAFTQNLATTVDSAGRIFGSGQSYGSYDQGRIPIGNQPFTSNGITWVPQGQFILQAYPSDPYNNRGGNNGW